MQLEQLIKEYDIPVVQIDEKRNYWLVRTQSGEYYDEFYFDSFIAIGWDEFNNMTLFRDGDKSIIVKEIEKQYPDNKQPGLVYNQICRFLFEMEVGDVVMIPSHNSTHITFGIIETHPYVEKISDTNIEEGVCPFGKRRKVRWIKTIKRTELDPYLYRMMQSHHTINNANDYADVIDRTLHSFYYKNGTAHLVVAVDKKDEVAALDLINGINNILELVPLIENPLNPNDEFKKEDIDLKLRVQSPGIMEFMSSGAAAWAVLGTGVLLTYIVGGKLKFTKTKEQTDVEVSTQGLLEKILKFKKHNDEQKLKELEKQNQQTARSLELRMPEETENLPGPVTNQED
ncbi:hypothetical protein OWP15_25595 [Bacillus paranthracis]|uniref:Uncharacterized protein n=1 Tax=Bacillus paranthracis TaxID=2026186 RepID=A0A9X8SBD9_9BACI|nr:MULTISPECIES: hypothetical protein [Bacillus cereus group]MDK7476036.1 hypothetical protein [Bacillus paranthracis]MDX5874482.1 hypothetical protein [Bacillus cereus group sp. BfR-BA-01344]SMD89584.1 hypothetical protein BACERE00221_01302 [Bacillus paranthracis]